MEKLFITHVASIPTGVKVTLNDGKIFRVKASFANGLLSQLKDKVPFNRIKFEVATSGDFQYLIFPEKQEDYDTLINHLQSLITKAV